MSGSLPLLYTYGVVERISKLVSSAAEKQLEEVERIFSDLRRVYPLLSGCITSDRGNAVQVVRCLNRVREIAYDIEDLVAIKQFNQKEENGTSSKLTEESSSLGDSITQLRQSLSELLVVVEQYRTADQLHSRSFFIHPDGSSLSRLGASPHYYGGIWSLVEGETIVGLDSNKEEIIQLIINGHNNPNVISIEGEAGVGKTTLAKMIYNSTAIQVSASFDLLLWASSPHFFPDLKGYLIEIICSFTKEREPCMQTLNVETLKYTLRCILQGQKYLVVLDDYKEGNGLGELMEIFEVGLPGSTVILVSAEPVFGASGTCMLQGLAGSDSWSLFAQCAGFDQVAEKDHPSFLTGVGRSIVDSCHGSPLAIKTLGRMLRTNRDELSWKQIAGTARDPFITSAEQMSADLLQCLYVCSFLSSTKVVPKDELIFSWMALGLLQSRDGNEEDPIDIGNRYCDELALRCFIQLFQLDGRPMAVLHHQVASLQGNLGGDSRCLSWSGDSRSKYYGFTPRDSSVLPSVRMFQFDNYLGPVREIFPNELISRLSHIRVLLLHGFKSEQLPESIGSLKLLTYLSLAGNDKLRALPGSVYKLRNLQTLDLTGCEHPKFTLYLSDLKNLRHLLLSLPETNIQDIWWYSYSLYHLRIHSSSDRSSLPERIAHISSLKVLQIHDCPYISSLPNSIKDLTSLTELSILNCEMLDLTNWDGLEGLRALRYLQIQGLPKLSKFPEGLESAANSLQHLVVSNCQSLIALPQGLLSCRKLVKMVIDSCPKLNARCQREVGDDWHLISHIPKFQLIQNPVYQERKNRRDARSLDIQEWVSREARMSKTFEYYNIQQESHIMSKATDEESKDPRLILLLLPEDYEIEKDSLIQLWMAVERVRDEQLGEKCFSDVLREKYLLLCGTNFMTGKARYRINTEKMNELLVSQKHNASSYLQWKKEYLNNIIPRPPAESIRHVSLGSSAEIDATTFETLEKFTQLRALLLLGDRAIQMPSRLLSSFSKLQALDLSRTHMKEVPSSIGHMIQLRYLDLSWTLIEWLPDVICSLAQLQTLKLRGCSNLRVLPERLSRLTELRHLDADVLGQFEVMPKRIGALVQLRTLPAFLVGTEDGCTIKEVWNLNNLSGELCISNLENGSRCDGILQQKKHLKKLELRWTASEICGKHQDSYDRLRGLQPPWILEELQIVYYEGIQFPPWMGNPRFNRLARIKIYMCENLFELPRIEQLPLLMHLELVGLRRVKKIELQRVTDACPKLEKLEIKDMQNLQVWKWQRRTGSDFRRLTHLIINDCPELKEFDVLSHLPSIKYFEIGECPKLQSLSNMKLPESLEELIVEECPHIQKKCVEGEGEDWPKIEHVPNKSIQEVSEDEYDG